MLKAKNKPNSDHVKVFVRIRPGNESHNTLTVLKKRELVVMTNTYSKRFQFDQVFGMDSYQTEVYESVVSPIITEVLKGYSCTVFAYGQTGTGKTYTMHGPLQAETTVLSEKNGIIPRAIKHIFDKLVMFDEGYVVSVSFLELYNEEIFDLLSTETDKKLRLYEDKKSASVIVQDLKEIIIKNPFDVFKILSEGIQKRQTAQTLLNANSSRSHSLFTVTIQMREGVDFKKIGKLNIVDLAGSENINRSGVIDKGAREASNINKSLLTLGRVMTALADRASHIPYRESKLTRILQDSLNGRAKTSIIATVSAALINVEETLNTLEYANRARSITIHPEINQRLPYETLMKELQDKLREKEALLQSTVQQSGIYLGPEQYQRLMQAADVAPKVNELRERNGLLIQKNTELETENAKLLEKVALLTRLKSELDDDKSKLMQTNGEIEHEKAQLLTELDERVRENRILNHNNLELQTQNNGLTQELTVIKEENQKLINEKKTIEERTSKITNVSHVLRTRLDNVYNVSNTNLKTFEESSRNLEQKFKDLVTAQLIASESASGSLQNYRTEIQKYTGELRQAVIKVISGLSNEFRHSYIKLTETVLQNVDKFGHSNVEQIVNFFQTILEPLVNQMVDKWTALFNCFQGSLDNFKEITNNQFGSIVKLKEIIGQMKSHLQNSLELNEQLKSEIQEHLDEKQKHLEKTLQMKRKELEEIETEHHLTFNKKAKFGDMFRTNSTNLQLIDCDQIVDTLANLEADCSKSLKICDTGTNISQTVQPDVTPDIGELKSACSKIIKNNQLVPINRDFFKKQGNEIASSLDTYLETHQSDLNRLLDALETTSDQEINKDLQQFHAYVEEQAADHRDVLSNSNADRNLLRDKFINLQPTGATPDRKFLQNFIANDDCHKENQPNVQ